MTRRFNRLDREPHPNPVRLSVRTGLKTGKPALNRENRRSTRLRRLKKKLITAFLHHGTRWPMTKDQPKFMLLNFRGLSTHIYNNYISFFFLYPPLWDYSQYLAHHQSFSLFFSTYIVYKSVKQITNLICINYKIIKIKKLPLF